MPIVRRGSSYSYSLQDSISAEIVRYWTHRQGWRVTSLKLASKRRKPIVPSGLGSVRRDSGTKHSKFFWCGKENLENSRKDSDWDKKEKDKYKIYSKHTQKKGGKMLGVNLIFVTGKPVVLRKRN